MMVCHVAERDFPDVEQHHGGTVLGSVWNAHRLVIFGYTSS